MMKSVAHLKNPLIGYQVVTDHHNDAHGAKVLKKSRFLKEFRNAKHKERILFSIIKKVLYLHPLKRKFYHNGKERKPGAGDYGVHRTQEQWHAWHFAVYHNQE